MRAQLPRHYAQESCRVAATENVKFLSRQLNVSTGSSPGFLNVHSLQPTTSNVGSGTAISFTVVAARTFFAPHSPQRITHSPPSHSIGGEAGAVTLHRRQVKNIGVGLRISELATERIEQGNDGRLRISGA